MKPLVITTKITKRESDSFKTYLREVSVIPTFETPEDEHECAVKAWNGDENARNELIRRNLRFVISCAKQYQVNGASLEDLVNEGNVGITVAASKFDPTKGYKFISYAVWHIRKDIMTYLSDNTRTIRIPTNKVGAIAKYKNRLDTLEQKLERTAEPNDILLAYSDYTKDDVSILNELALNSTMSLDMEVGGDDDSKPLSELIPDASMGRADGLTLKSDMEIDINALMSKLTLNERDIISRLYGLDGKIPETLASVGEYYDISRESVRQRRDKALIRIQRRIRRSTNKRNVLND